MLLPFSPHTYFYYFDGNFALYQQQFYFLLFPQADCIIMTEGSVDEAGLWENIDCNHNKSYICQMDSSKFYFSSFFFLSFSFFKSFTEQSNLYDSEKLTSPTLQTSTPKSGAWHVDTEDKIHLLNHNKNAQTRFLEGLCLQNAYFLY